MALFGAIDVNAIDWFAFWTVRMLEALRPVKPLALAKLADTPLFRPALYVPAAISVPVAVPFEVRYTVVVAMPEVLVVPLPTLLPFNLKSIVWPLRPEAFQVSVALSV